VSGTKWNDDKWCATYNYDTRVTAYARKNYAERNKVNNLHSTNFCGGVTDHHGTLQGLSSTIDGFLSTISSNVQTQLNIIKTKASQQS
jgi:hypothetical protein